MSTIEQEDPGVSEEYDGSINSRWRHLFTLWHEEFGMDSVRVHQIAPLAARAGFLIVVASDTHRVGEEGALPSLSRFGMLLRHKHRHVHNGLRLISDRIELGWSKKTTGSTYHLEPKDEPRGYDVLGGFQRELGASEE